MGFINKIGKAKSKISSWMEEREQKSYDKMKVDTKLAKQYNKRSDEKAKMQKTIDTAKTNKFNNSFIGKAIKGAKDFDKKVNKPKKKSMKKKKGKNPTIKRRDSDMFGDGDPWA